MADRVGWGFDAHRFGGEGPVLLCGVEVDAARGVEATSDGDVAAHALIDALLGAAGLGDLGSHFGTNDPEMRGADSMALLAGVIGLLAEAGYRPSSVDITVVSESIRIAPHREAMRSRVAKTLGIDVGAVSVKATSTDGLGAIGADEGLAAAAIAVISAG